MNKTGFTHQIQDQLQAGVRHNKVSVENLASSYGIRDKNLVKELTELAIVRIARRLAHQGEKNVYERYRDILELYKKQVTLSHRTSFSILLQQYSTASPLAYLMGVYCGIDKDGFYFEPSAGNGLLTIAGSPENFSVNEIDKVRNENLASQGFAFVTANDASQDLFKLYGQVFDAVLTNPPFGKLAHSVEIDGYKITQLDHLMVIRALACMKANGKCAIIIGGHTTWDEKGRITIGRNRIFLNYLYSHYHVDDVILIDGDLYKKQGTAFDIRLILINGRKPIISGVAPLYNETVDSAIFDFDTLYSRIMKNVKSSSPVSSDLLKAKALALELELDILNAGGLGMAYQPASESCFSLEVDTPDSMAFEMQQALAALKSKIGSIDEYVRKKLHYQTSAELCAALSAEQIDAVALSIFNIEERSQALIEGDQTGIGKGRIAAALIRYGIMQGKIPILFTEKPTLFSDMYRDLKAIGAANFPPYIVNTRESKTLVKDEDGTVIYEPLERTEQDRIIKSGALPSNFKYVLVTYSQVSTGEFNDRGELIAKNPKGSWLEAIADRAMVILDEAHNAGGSGNTGKVLRDIVRIAWGVTFLSATFAKRPDNMPLYALRTAMSETNMSREELILGIEKGGVALQEVISAQLVQHGQMIRRERSYEGIEVNYLTLDEKAAEHRAISDNITQIVRDIIEFQKKYIDGEIEQLDKIAAAEQKEITTRQGTKRAGVDNQPYFSKVFQVINQMLFAIKADAVADRAIMRLKEGKKPVIAFSSTMGSFLENLENDNGYPVGDGDRINADFATVLVKGLEGVLRYSERDSTGKLIHHRFDVTELNKEAQAEYFRIANHINSVSSGIVISPIDLIKQKVTKAGYRVAEVTGRKLELEYLTRESNPGKGIAALVKSRKRENANDAFRKFQNNEVDVLLINQSGATGASAHAIPTVKVKAPEVKQRVMILLQAELDINTEVQKRGRINRTGQIYKPIYDYVSSAIPAEKRLMMMLQKKLKSLDANTTSNQKQSEAILNVDDFLNKIGDKLVVEYLAENDKLNSMIDDPFGLKDSKDDSSKRVYVEDAIHKVSGRVAVLPTDLQEKFYTDILQLYKEEVEYLKQAGEYDLEVETLDLKSRTLEKQVKIVGKGGSSAFGDNTYIEKCEVNLLKKPYTVTELQNLYSQALGEKQPMEVKAELLEELARNKEQQMAAIFEQWNTYYDQLLSGITSERAYQKLNDENEKHDYVQKRTQEINAARKGKIDHQQDKVQNRSITLRDFFSFFHIGRALYYPLDFDQGNAKSFAISLGFRLDIRRENPFTPSAVKLQVVIASSKKRVDIPLSKTKDILAIMGASATVGYSWEDALQQWPTFITSASKDRGIVYIVTGNLLQSYGEESFNRGRLITFTTQDEKIRKGRLMPDGWSAKDDTDKDLQIKVPISKALTIIASLVNGGEIHSDIGLSIFKSAEDQFKLVMSASRSAGGEIYTDLKLNALMLDGKMDKSGNSMKANFIASNLKEVLTILQGKHNASVFITPSQLELIQHEIEENKFSDVVTLIPVKEERQIIIDNTALDLIRLKAKALEVELELLAI